MGRIAFLLAPLLVLAACDGPSASLSVDTGDDSEAGGNGAVTIAGADNGAIALKVPGFETSVKLPKIDISAEDFDVNGVKLYPGSKIRNFHIDAEKSGAKDRGDVTIDFESPAAVSDVRGWFAGNMADRGFKVSPKGDGLAGTTDEGDPITLELKAAGEKSTRGTLRVGA